MTKSQLIDQISRRVAGVPRRDVEVIVNTVFNTMVDALCATKRIEIRGFGSLAVKVRESRGGRNPKTGQKVDVPRRRVPHFILGKELRERLNPKLASNDTTREAAPPDIPGFPAIAEALAAASTNSQWTSQ